MHGSTVYTFSHLFIQHVFHVGHSEKAELNSARDYYWKVWALKGNSFVVILSLMIRPWLLIGNPVVFIHPGEDQLT